MYLANIFVLVVALGAFMAVGAAVFRRLRSPSQFFHNSQPSGNMLSLAAANVTVGSGIVYLVVGGYQNRILMYLVPLAVLLGYLLLYLFAARVVPSKFVANKNFLQAIDREIVHLRGGRSGFALTISLALVLAYLLFLAFEVFATSQFMTPLLFEAPGVGHTILVSAVIFVVAVAYTLAGGISAVFKTDKIQIVCVIAVVLTLIAVAMNAKSSIPSTQPSEPLLRWDATALWAMAAACLAAVATQFYSLLNWTALSHLELRHQRSVLLGTGSITVVLLSCMVTVGLLLPPGDQPLEALQGALAEFNQASELLPRLAVWITLAGLAAIIFSTVDSLMIAAVLSIYDNVLHRDSYLKTEDSRELRKIRGLSLACFAAVFGGLIYLHLTQPNLFYLLLTIAGGVGVFAPMLVTAGYLSRSPRGLAVMGPLVVAVYILLFLGTFVTNLIALQYAPQFTAWLGTLAILSSIGWSGIVIILAKGRKV